jgi:CBS domain-containing protein
MNRKIVPDVISGVQNVATADSAMSVREAAVTMAKRRIGAVVVLDATDRMAGIFTERDVMTKVVAAHRDPDTTTLAEVMTPDPDTIGPDDTAAEALDMMRKRGYRHLPVVEGGRLIGMVSVRDLYATALVELEQGLQERDAFISGSAGYGLT